MYKIYNLSNNIRNFCIIAHIDHGKSTLADRLLDFTGSVTDREKKDQLLDDMELEREKGITIKSHAVQMDYEDNGEKFILNLIDTPGHVDFSYEVSRAIAACEGALLVVDAAQSIQAQTISNLYLAVDNDLEIIPVVNKIDLPSANPEVVVDEIVTLIGCKPEEVILASAKTGEGIKDIIRGIIDRVPSPEGSPDMPLQALIFDSVFNPYRGIETYFKVVKARPINGSTIASRAIATALSAIVLSDTLSTKEDDTHACFLLSITRRPISVVSDLSICSRCPCKTSTEIDALVTAITSAVLARAFFASSRSAFVKSESLFSITSP